MSASLIALPFAVALIVAALCTPAVARLARIFGVVDKPNLRKISIRGQMPLLGGLAVAAGVAAGLVAVSAVYGPGILPADRLRGFFFGAGLILGVGIIDDRFGMGAASKLIGQIAAASIVFHAGFAIESFRSPMSGDSFALSPLVSYALTLFWIVAVTNAVNLIDGLDGLATGISLIMAVTMAYVCLTADQVTGVVFGAAIVGGALGFLPYNFPPARIFLGDTGALFLGFSISLLAVEGYMGGYRRASVLPFIVPLMALAVPLIDTSLSILRRIRSGAGVFSADSMHMHHRLLRSEGSHGRAVIFLYLLTACFCAISVYFAILEDLVSAGLLLVVVLILTVRLVNNLGLFSEWTQTPESARASTEEAPQDCDAPGQAGIGELKP